MLVVPRLLTVWVLVLAPVLAILFVLALVLALMVLVLLLVLLLQQDEELFAKLVFDGSEEEENSTCLWCQPW